MHVAVAITPSHNNLPSARWVHGRVKLCASILMQRRGTMKAARFGATHPTATQQSIMAKARLTRAAVPVRRRILRLQSGILLVSVTLLTSRAVIRLRAR
jgi:hypothetical protein